MKPLLILGFTIVALAHQVVGQVPKRYDVVGPVASFRQETAKLKEVNGEIVEGPRVLIQTATFNDHGDATERLVYNSDGSLKWKGKWIARSTYDSQGRETERTSYNDNGEVTSRTVWVYEVNGNLTKSVTYGDTGEIKFYNNFEYDKNGHRIRADYMNGDGTTRGSDLFVYDSRGHLIEVTHSKNILQYRDTYKYDERGNETEWSVYDRSGKRGLKVSWAFSDQSRGIPTEFVQYDSSDKVLSREIYSYEFDSRGNWIRSKTIREVFSGQSPVAETEITYRTIVYRDANEL
jgi:hypothetical protein